MTDAETVVACLTPPGTAAVATIAVHGPAAWTTCCALFVPRKGALPTSLDEIRLDRFWLGRMGGDLKDEVVLAVKRITPVPWIEIHCHGGREVVAMLLEQFASRGLARCSWEDFQRRTAESSLAAEASIALARAATARSAAILLDQFGGAFTRALADIGEALERNDANEAGRLLDALVRYSSLGRHLTMPWRVVVAGAPNVGKSSLVNAVAGYQRCVVAETPGTTRDVVTTLLALDGWPVELADTAGQRTASETIEAAGIEMARDTLKQADLCLWVLDASVPPLWPEDVAVPVIHVVNKCDLPPAWDLASEVDGIHVSARTGEGIAELCDALARRLVPDVPPTGAAVPFTEEWCRRVETARKSVGEARMGEAHAYLSDVGGCEAASR